MKFESGEDLLDFMSSAASIAAVNTAMEERLFWRLAEQDASDAELSDELGIPRRRCRYWLDLLVQIGLLDRRGNRYASSAWARRNVLESLRPESWAQLAVESRERLPVLIDLTRNIRERRSAWEILGFTAPNYVQALREDPERARRFTCMLGELHAGLARALADILALDGARRLMDLGGGSGVMSLRLLERHPRLEAVVVDLPHVCAAGRELARSHPAGDRLSFHPADFTVDALPTGFDVILECDINIYGVELFRRLRRCLRPAGRLLILDLLALVEGEAPAPRVEWAFRNSLADPDFLFPGVEDVQGQLLEAGFAVEAPREIQPDWILLEATPAP